MSVTCGTDEWTYPRGSIDELRATVRSSVLYLDAQVVQMSLDGIAWVTGTWAGPPGYERVVVANFDFGDYYRGDYTVRVKVTDSPLAPIFFVGTVHVV